MVYKAVDDSQCISIWKLDFCSPPTEAMKMSSPPQESLGVLRPKYSGKITSCAERFVSNNFYMICTHQAHSKKMGVRVLMNLGSGAPPSQKKKKIFFSFFQKKKFTEIFRIMIQTYFPKSFCMYDSSRTI